MNSYLTDGLLSVLRSLLMFVGGIVVAKGWLTADVSNELMGAIISIASVLFSQLFHAQANNILPQPSTTSNASSTEPKSQ